jgi:diguanylate cyclase (GGDEF)-like protein
MQEDSKINNHTHKVSVSQQWGTARLRFLFLLPMSLMIALIIFVLGIIIYEYTTRDVEKGVIHIRASVQNFYEESIRYDAKALQAILHTLRQNDNLATALTQRNRDDLLRLASPLFEDIKRDFEITHLYFSGVDRVNLLRVHTPLRYGDTINRITMLQAQKSGAVAYGVELGPLGTFTLRVVAPWYDNQTHKLIGYVELGMELNQVIEKLQNFFGVQPFIMINKEFLDQTKWEAGMRTLGRTAHWNHFANKVLSEQSTYKLPPVLAEHLIRGEVIADTSIINLIYEGLSYRVTSLPLHNAGGIAVAEMILLTDVSKEEKIARKTLYEGIIIVFVAGAILFAFFYWLIGQIGQRIEQNEKKLHDIATHDGLTGLYNHKFFYTLLENEIIRAERYQHHTSLLLLDIDHFKNVNDTYGHRSGDMILSGLSKRLMSRIRTTDSVCRYGGEEITIILPETDIMIAKQIAENLRVLIEHEPFEIEDNQHIKVTVSIGVSVYPQHATKASTLVSVADTALYKAKENGRNCVCVYETKEKKS